MGDPDLPEIGAWLAAKLRDLPREDYRGYDTVTPVIERCASLIEEWCGVERGSG